MPWHTIKTEAKISAIFRYLKSRQRELRTFIGGEKEAFRTRISSVIYIRSETGAETQLVIQRLDPEEGNELIESASVIRMEGGGPQKLDSGISSEGSFRKGADHVQETHPVPLRV